ncbi:MAG: TraB/GumN family protein [Alphaproteobacteria bacterium]|nr:TraB/GumN family protein [Alphaproteobacteria bacterium]MBU1514248.1 TraB/GumN family protein [Alphaproteobacteria bacterium]MBU2093306.1 TraB/GumN family protein [Alphaproteobacteria bacterium]MBU2153397.1 TraB/GumN family protein [Alphaproteobacteria bacterium]MBU2307088.1 TraB/GumN family protein [Alphaproteobacteria bacterium]
MRFLAGLAAAVLLTAPAHAAPPVWVVKDADSEMLLFGSIHVLPPGLAWRPAALDAGLKRADDLWFELPAGPAAEQEIARLAAATGLLPPGQSLFTLLTPRDAELLIRAADGLGLDKTTLDRLEPWLAEVALAGAAYRAAGADTEHGVEKAVETTTPPKVQRRALETPAEQLSLFDQSPRDEQIASLNETVRELQKDPEGYNKLIRAWMAGDADALDREALEPLRKASPGVFRRLVTERNARWIVDLDARLKGKGRTVVVVGVGHLVGPDGLPAKLRALGYSVTGP